MNEVLTVKEAGLFLRKHPDTIRRWIEEKKLPARKFSAGKNGVYVILRNDLLEHAVSETLERKAQAQSSRKHAAANRATQVQLPI